MIPKVNKRTLDTISSQMERDKGEYIVKIADKLARDQPVLDKYLDNTLCNIVDNVCGKIINKEESDFLKVHIFGMCVMLLHSISAQDEINEMKEEANENT